MKRKRITFFGYKIFIYRPKSNKRKYISFAKYMKLPIHSENDKKECRPEIFRKLTKYLRQSENINLKKDFTLPKDAINLFNEQLFNTHFMENEPENIRQECLFCLSKYYCYLAYLDTDPEREKRNANEPIPEFLIKRKEK